MMAWDYSVSSSNLCKNILGNLEWIRSWYKHESCSLWCQEQVRSNGLPWIRILSPENSREQRWTASILNQRNLFKTWPIDFKPIAKASKWRNASNGGGFVVWNRLKLREDFRTAMANRGDEFREFESELV
jgi:hypothetical protein